MSGFQRFVAYINRYEGNSKIHNVGFAKIETREEQCSIEIHMKGTGYTGIECPVYVFVREDDKMWGISLGKIQLTNGSGDRKILINRKNMNQSGYSFEQVGGFVIFVSEQVMFASQWDDRELLREQFYVVEEEQPPELETRQTVREQQIEEETLHATETAQAVVLQPQEEPWAVKWQFIQENYPVLTPFEGEDIICIRLELKDLRLLPKRYWYLGNNSFLLHGFFNYRYLILGEMEQEGKRRWFLGVPGVFQNQEKVMATIFGFPEFKSEKIAKQKTNQFGYWYRFME